MIEKLYYMNANSFIPYANQALEEHLLQKVQPGELILYLWQNKRTVVVGRNQNCWKECKIEQLLRDQGHPARRISGGGAVFQDLGNLNFTFITCRQDYDVGRQLEAIINAVKKLGINAEKSGRNDVLVDGRKFSGNAFYRSADKQYHHGTLMVDVNLADLSRYLQPSKEKLQAKGIESVRSRVVNLKEINSDISVASLRGEVVNSFAEMYGLTPKFLHLSDDEKMQVSLLEQRYADWGWIFGKNVDFDIELAEFFPWGSLSLNLQVVQGRVWQTVIYSDALEGELISNLNYALKDCRYHCADLIQCLQAVETETANEEKIISDICQWLKDKL